MSRRNRLAAQLDAVASHAQAKVDNEPTPPVPASNRPPRAAPIRITTDLPPLQHAWLKEWCATEASAAGVSSIRGAEVIRALLDELKASTELRARISEAIIDRQLDLPTRPQ